MKTPNIVLINCDDLGYGDLGCYGSKRNKTPEIDRMAAEGMRLTSFYMASPVCSPSRGGMLTGCYPPRIGFGNFDGEWVLFPGQGLGLNPSETTIADILKRQGYHTKLVGKWHCGDQPEFLPTRHGFDEYFGLPYSNDMGRQINQETPPLPLMCDERVIQQQPDQSSLTERYVEQSTRFIHDHREESFFLYLAHMHVHLPLYTPERFRKESHNGDYGACVSCVDWATKCILHQLEEEGILENTLVIFTSDNGCRGDHGGTNYPLRGHKGQTWEGVQRVPCILYWPGHIEAGVTCEHIVSSIDFLPTIAGLCNTKLRPDVCIDGIDFCSLLEDSTASPTRDTFFYYILNNLEAVRHGDWKLHTHKDGDAMRLLYNLTEDIAETNNLYEQYPDIVKQLEALMDVCREDLGDEITGVKGANVREVGRVSNPTSLTEYDANYPYIEAEYDSMDCG